MNYFEQKYVLSEDLQEALNNPNSEICQLLNELLEEDEV